MKTLFVRLFACLFVLITRFVQKRGVEKYESWIGETHWRLGCVRVVPRYATKLMFIYLPFSITVEWRYDTVDEKLWSTWYWKNAKLNGWWYTLKHKAFYNLADLISNKGQMQVLGNYVYVYKGIHYASEPWSDCIWGYLFDEYLYWSILHLDDGRWKFNISKNFKHGLNFKETCKLWLLRRFSIRINRWSDGMPTLFITFGDTWKGFTLAIGGFAGNCFPGLHIDFDHKRLIKVTYRTTKPSYLETVWYIRLFQKVTKYANPHDNYWLQYPASPRRYRYVLSINCDSEHFIMWCRDHRHWKCVEYKMDYSSSGRNPDTRTACIRLPIVGVVAKHWMMC